MDKIAKDLVSMAKSLVAGRTVDSILSKYCIGKKELMEVYKQLPDKARRYRDDRGRTLYDLMTSWQAPYIWIETGYMMGAGYGDMLTGGASSQAEGRKKITGEKFLKLL